MDENIKIKVEYGNFTNTEWVSIPAKIKTAIENANNANSAPAYDTVFSRNILIILVKTSEEYNFFKTTGDGTTLYINLANFNDLTPADIRFIVSNLSLNRTHMAKTPVPKYDSAMQLRDNRIANKMGRHRSG